MGLAQAPGEESRIRHGAATGDERQIDRAAVAEDAENESGPVEDRRNTEEALGACAVMYSGTWGPGTLETPTFQTGRRSPKTSPPQSGT